MRHLPLALVLSVLASPLLADQRVISASHDMLAAMTGSIAGQGPTVVVPAAEGAKGADPANFRPDIAQITEIQGADLIVLNGAGYEPWAARVSLPRARTVDTTAAMKDDLIQVEGLTHSHGESLAHSHHRLAPIVWLDFTLAARQAQAIADALSRQFPDDAQTHAANLATLEQHLSALDAQARAIGTALGGQTLLIAHPGYEYFSRAYGISLRETTFDATIPATREQIQALDNALGDGTTRIILFNAAPPAQTATALAARDITVVVLPDGTQTPDGQDPLDLIAAGLTALAAAV